MLKAITATYHWEDIDFSEAMPLEKKVNNSVEYQVANASDKNRYRKKLEIIICRIW